MTSRFQKKIDALKRQIAELEAVNNRDNEILKGIYAELQENLKNQEVSFDSFVRFAQRDIRRVIAKMDRETEEAAEGGEGAAEAPKRRGRGPGKRGAAGVGAGAGRKKAVRRKGGKAEVIKIAPGRYTRVPPDLERVFDIKEKGARPKAVKAYAKQIGLNAFMEQCLIADETPSE